MALIHFLGLDIFKGLAVTLKNFFKPKTTLYFPNEKAPKSSRFRGLHALRKYTSGEERCIGCKLCEATCPALAITIEVEPRDDGSRRTTRYDIDLFKCVYCGFCEEACPVDAIVQTNITDYTFAQRGNNILTKSDLLRIGDHHAQALDKDLNADAPYR